MKILISNDDGYQAPGIQALANVMSSFASVVVVAPERNRSGASNALTLDKPLSVTKIDDSVYFVDGTPSDCVHIALTGLLDFTPDLILSGINQGQNMGDDTIYSGTVAAATEGYLFGIPAIAFSQVDKDWVHLDSAANFALEFIKANVNRMQAQAPYLLNINIPNRPEIKLNELKLTRLGKRHKSEPVIKSMDPRGKPIYWIGPPGNAKLAGEGTDFHAVEHGFVSVTPLQIDLTNHAHIAAFKKGWE